MWQHRRNADPPRSVQEVLRRHGKSIGIPCAPLQNVAICLASYTVHCLKVGPLSQSEGNPWSAEQLDKETETLDALYGAAPTKCNEADEIEVDAMCAALDSEEEEDPESGEEGDSEQEEDERA
jgi:hypothetical protein